MSDPTESPSTRLTFLVEGVSCAHCVAAVTEEVTGVDGVTAVDVDLDTKLVTVDGTSLNADALRAAIDEAGYDAVPA